MTPSSFEQVLRAQTDSNRNAEAHAALYAGHRARLTDAIAGLGGERLCLLGAGACLDVDLAALTARYGQVHLVDLDAAAVTRAHDRQPPEVRLRLHRHAPVDLSGVLRRLDEWCRQPATLADLEAAVATGTSEIVGALPAPFDAVASCCLATQLSRSVTTALGPDNPWAADVRRAVAAIHLRSLAAALVPGGRALFASDLVSNETFPLDELPGDTDLPALATRLVQEGNFFKGADPAMISRLMRRDPLLSRVAGPPRPLLPWLWRSAPERMFLVTGFVFDRRTG